MAGAKMVTQTRISVASIVSCLMLSLLIGDCRAQQQYFVERPQNNSVREGETAILRCKVGNQQGRAQWTKDGFALGFERNIPSFPRYTVVGSEQLGEHHMRIENATLDDDAEYQCQVGPNGSQKPIRSDARLTVLIPPTTVEIIDFSPGARIQARENEEIVLQCLVRNAKPAADIVWLKRNQEIKFGKQENSTVENAENNRRFDTRSTITIRAQADDNDADYSCEARHPALMATKRASVTFSVLYPPGPPEISGYTEGEKVRMGQEVNLVCISRGGNPLAQIVWYKNNEKVDNSFVTSGREARNTYSFKADASDNNARFRCEASNQLSVTTMKAEITLTVHFPPTHVTMRVRPEKLRPGQSASLTCESASSNPPSRLTWIRNGVAVPSTSTSMAFGAHGGNVTKSTLQVEVTPELHGAVFTCQATNDIGGQNIHDAVTMEVLYKPHFLHPVDYTVDVIEGEPALVNLSVRANPSGINYSWSRDGTVFKAIKDASLNDRITANGPILNLTVVRRTDDGPFKCDATNSEGSSSAVVRLNVQYPASIVDTRSQVMVSEGSDAFLECRATGNPLTATTLKWRREGFDMEGRTDQRADVGVAFLTVREVARNDTGAFECVADNGIGQETVFRTWLIVKYKPMMDNSPQYQKAAGNEGERAKLVCRAHGAPNITFQWSREGSTITGGKYDRVTEQVDVVTWESCLYVNSVESDDYGQYECVARNEMGFDRAVVYLSGTSRPDVPISLRVLNVTHDSVELAWKAGFDGGLPQTYQIRYRQMGTDFFKYADVYPPNSTSMNVGGLALGTEYLFSVMASNSLGKSNFTNDIVKARTSSPWDEAGVLSDTLSSRGDAPKIIIIAVSTAGALLLVINITLITCYLIRRRKKKCMEEAMSSEGGSSKSATIEMYAPSSYNETVNGETLSSISEKSESYSQNGSHSDYAHEDATKAAVSTYLIDQGDGQVAYGTYRVGGGGVNGGPNPNGNAGHVGTLSRPPKTVNFDMGDDNYIDTLRRNAFSPANDPNGVYGKSRGNPAIAANPDAYYNVNPSPVSSNEARYAPYPPVHPSFGPPGNHNNRYNPLSEPVNQSSPYTPMGTLNIPAANGTLGHHSNGYTAGRTPVALPVNLPLPLPMSMQQGSHGHFSSFSSDGPPSLEATAHFSGPSMATVRSLETEGHLV